MEKLLTVKDVSEFLQMSKEKIYKMAQDGKIPVLKIENQWRFRRDRIDLWLETKEISPAEAFEGDKDPSQAWPFLKWAGGKGQLLDQMNPFFPKDFSNYIEPFIGAGAVFFHLNRNGLLGPSKKLIIIDSNEDLINCYQVIKAQVEDLISHLKQPKFANDENMYYRIRAESPENPVERAARIIYLNKTCFNGLYRVNSQGKFNVPFGRYTNPLICDSDNLRAVNKALQKVKLVVGDFQEAETLAGKNDFIYFDPPYQPVSKTANFTGFTKEAFGDKDQGRLFETFKKLDQKGCKMMLSNSDAPLIHDLYKGYRIEKVLAKRAINAKPSGRGQIAELLMLNY